MVFVGREMKCMSNLWWILLRNVKEEWETSETFEAVYLLLMVKQYIKQLIIYLKKYKKPI